MRVFRDVLAVTIEIVRNPSVSADEWIAAIAAAHPVLLDDPSITATMRSSGEELFVPLAMGQSGCNERFCRSEFWASLENGRAPEMLQISWAEEVEGLIDLRNAGVVQASRTVAKLW